MNKALVAAVLFTVIGAADAQESRPFVIAGTVVAPPGAAVPGGTTVTLREARVRRRPNDSRPAVEERSQTAGSGAEFRFEVPSGNYVLVVAAPGFARARRFVAPDTVLPEPPDRLVIHLVPGMTVSGRLVEARSGKAIAGGRLRAAGGGGAAEAVETVSDADGAFVLAGVSAEDEDLRIVASAPKFAPKDVPIDASSPAEPITIALEPAWLAEVRVVDDRGQPVVGALVRARLPFAVPYSNLERHDFEARADASGIAAFDDLVPAEPVVFEVTHDPHVPTRSAPVLPHPAPDGSPHPSAEIVLTEGRAVRITVRDAFDAPLDESEVRVAPLVEPRLEVAGHTPADQYRGSMRTGLTDATGTISFEKLPAELLTVEVRSPLFETRMIVIDLRGFPLAEAVVRLERDPDPPAASMPWVGSVRQAFAMSQRADLPVFVSMAMDGERANDWIAAHHFKDPEVVRVAELLPCLLSSVFGEGGLHAEGVDHGENDDVCTRYGSVPCGVHQEVEAYARQEIMSGATGFQVPRNVFVTADGRVIEHRGYYLSERDLRWMILRALRATGSSAGVWLSVRRLQPLWRALCSENDTEERRTAITAVAQLASSGDEYALALLQDFGLDAIPPVVRLRILDSLLLAAIPDPVHALRSFLHDPEKQVRQRAWQLLRSVSARVDLGAAVPYVSDDERDDTVVAAALKALRVEDQTNSVLVAEADHGDRWMLVEMLLATLDAASIKGLDLVLDGSGTEGRNRILRALAELTDDESSIRRVFGHAAAPDATAVAAIRAIATSSAGLDERGRELLRQQAKSQNALVRQEVMTQIGRHPMNGGPEILESALADPASPVRMAAAVGLARQGRYTSTSAQIMLEAMADPEFGIEILTILGDTYEAGRPANPASWLEWMKREGLIPKDK